MLMKERTTSLSLVVPPPKKTYMKKILFLIIVLFSFFSLIMINFLKEANVNRCYIGNESNHLFSANELIKYPRQYCNQYPVIYESRGMFDFSSIVLFEADCKYFDCLIEKYKLEASGNSFQLSNLLRNLRCLKLHDFVERIRREQWTHFSGGEVSGYRNNLRFNAHFELFVNISKNRAILYYHSFTRVKSMCD